MSLLTAGQIAAGYNPASDLRPAQNALNDGDYEKAFVEYLNFAEKNNALAQFTVALFYENGWGRPQNKVEACRWFGKAAQANVPVANHFYGECVEKGIGQQADAKEAVNWYQKAADQGHYISLCSIADLYMTNPALPFDPVKAISFCQQAAERDIPEAQVQTGLYYLNGDKVVQDYAKAAFWLLKAAEKNMPEAQYYLGTMLQDGLGMDKNIVTARIWFEKAASQGYIPAYFPCGELYLAADPAPNLGILSAEDLAKAYLWLSAALKTSKDSREITKASNLLEDIQKTMPATWQPTLDAKVAAHLKSYSPARISHQ